MSTTSGWVLDTGSQSHICVDVQVLESRRDLAKGEADIRVADGSRVRATAVGVVHLSLPSGLILTLNNCYCVPSFWKDKISISLLVNEGFNFAINNSDFELHRNGIYYGSAPMINGLYVLDTSKSDYRAINNVNTKRLKIDDTNETRLWHCR